VLLDHGFVQTAEAVKIKFKSSVARGMHLGVPGRCRPDPSRGICR
jgi:hypothetical protein